MNAETIRAVFEVIRTIVEIVAVIFIIWGFKNESKVAEWEYKYLWNPLKRFIRTRMKSNARFMKWLNKPQKHGRPDEDFIAGQVKVFGDVWRL